MPRPILMLLLLGALLPGAAVAQRTHPVKLIRSGDGEHYRFDPDRVEARAGDVLLFTVESGGPYVVAFEPADLSPGARDLVAGALGNSAGIPRSRVLRGQGDRLRVVIPALPKGTYRFSSALHVAYRMAGQLVLR